MPPDESARIAYDHCAGVYDEWNAQNDYEMWLGDVLLPELEKHGLRRGWALDVGCGTGRAFEPLLSRGWSVVGCDASEGMLAEADRAFGTQVRLLRLDARQLSSVDPLPTDPEAKGFQLILLLNDVLNYLIEDGDLENVFAGLARNLAPEGGLVAFDVNTLRLFRDDFASDDSQEGRVEGWEWAGLSHEVRPGGIFEARMSGRGVEAHVHRQRHWTAGEVREALRAAGLNTLAALGQREEGGRVLLTDPPDEERDEKIIYIAGGS
jgi:SAM-dependent methyltransferase